MKPEEPEPYIRNLERGVGQTPEAAPQPFATSFSGQPGRGFARLTNSPRRRLMLAVGIASAVAIALFLGHYASRTTVHGDLIMINTGAKDTIACNDGNLRLDGSNNTYTVTGHCRRLEIFGGANHVTVDSADTISVFGDDNAVIYHSGSPTINRTGNNNTVAERLARTG